MKRPLLCLLFVSFVWASSPCSAGTYTWTQFCWQSDGSLDAYRYCTSSDAASSIHVVTPNPGFSDQVFDGKATPIATTDTWKVALAVNLSDYRRDMYIWSESVFGINAVGTAGARMVDRFTVNGGTGSYSLHFLFSLNGVLSESDVWMLAPTMCAEVRMPQGIGKGSYYCQPPALPIPSTIVLTDSRLPFGVPVDTMISIEADAEFVSIFPQEVATIGDLTVSDYATANFIVHLESILVTDDDGKPIRGVSISSQNGIAYPLDPLNAAVPEPAWLSPMGLLALVVFRRLRR